MNKAIGGKTGRMPWFFQFSKNGRHNKDERRSKKKTFLKPNNSTMNRIWKRFSTIGNINMNMADVKPFNYMMLLDSVSNTINYDAINIFCEMDSSNQASLIEAAQETDLGEMENIKGYDILADLIKTELVERFGSLEAVYPSIVKYLFTEENATRPSHKQMFWRVFGEIAVTNLERNLRSCHICQACGTRIPNWYPIHECNKNTTGFVTCCDCGKIAPRLNSRQQRCPECQAEHKRILAYNRKKRQRKKKVA